MRSIHTFIKKKIDVYAVFLFVIIMLSIFFRFYNYPFRYGFTDETIREAVIGIEGAREKQAPLTGGFSSAGPFVWGPWFYYQMIIVSLLAPFHYSTWVYLGITSIFCVIFLYKIGQQLEDKVFGLILAFFGCLSPAFIISSTHLTFPNLTNVFAIATFLLFIILIQKNVSYWWSVAFGVLLGIGVNIHFQMAGLFIFLFLLLYKYKKIIYFVSAFCGTVFTFIPLILFDLTNYWHNLRSILFYYMHGRETIYVPNSWTLYLRDFWPSYWGDVVGVSPVFAVGIIILALGVLTWLFYKKKISIIMVLIIIAFLVNFIQLRYYFGERFFGYLNHFRPFVIIFTGYVVYFFYKVIRNSRFKKLSLYFLIGVLSLFSILILPNSIKKLQKDPFTEEMYRKENLFEKHFPNKKFSLYLCGSPKTNHAEAASVVFLLDMKHKLSDYGVKIGIKDKYCVYPNTKITADNLNGIYPMVDETNIIDFSNATTEQLEKANWKQFTFKTIYDSTAHWWYKENLE